MVSLGLDITASVAYEEQLKEARATAESANRAKSAFLANMSHEIRTPMNGVVGMADVLTDTELSDEQRLYVETIKNSGEALLVIINDVLDYSKIDAQKLDLHPETFDLERAIQEVLMLLQPSARSKEISMLLDYDMNLPTQLIGDPGRIRQVLTNLAGNAVKFTSEGHVLVRVTGAAVGTTNTVTLDITIEDTGIGIPEDMVEHIFGEFNQVENERNRKFDGTGLGLAISQRLIEMMDGKIWVTSEEGVGSCFGVTLAMSPAGEIQPENRTLPDGLRRIMIVDDIEINRTILKRQLEHMGLGVTSCSSGAEALEHLDDDIDLILTDHRMPGMNGLELAETVRASGNDIPIFLLSSDPRQAEKDPARTHVEALLQKPLHRQELFEQLRSLALAPIRHEPKPSPPPLRKLRVLAAEDNKTNQLVFRKMIKDLDVELAFADNGEEAVAMFKRFVPDIIFMDISMPKMDGKEATKLIRALEERSGEHVPIVALTAHAMEGDDKGILAAGLDHYLTKPLRKPEITKQIVAACGNDILPPSSADTLQATG